MKGIIIIASICLVSIATNSAEKKSTKQITFANCTEARAAGYEDIKVLCQLWGSKIISKYYEMRN